MRCGICGEVLNNYRLPSFKKWTDGLEYELLAKRVDVNDDQKKEIVEKKPICYECVGHLLNLRYRPEIKGKEDKTVIIPAGATNGDVIQALFPDAPVWTIWDAYQIGLEGEYYPSSFSISWWNKEYKKG